MAVRILENNNKKKYIKESSGYARLVLKSESIREVVSEAIVDSYENPDSLISNLASGLSVYSYNEETEEDDPRKLKEVEAFWNSLRDALDAVEDGYF